MSCEYTPNRASREVQPNQQRIFPYDLAMTWFRRERLAGDLWPVLALALGRFVVHVGLGNRYGFHRDELATLSDSMHLAWGYVAYPPVTPILGRLGLELFGLAPLSVRWIAALAQALIVVLAGMMARDLGASRKAQFVAAFAVAIAPLSMLQGVLFQYVSFDMLWWSLLAWLTLRLARSNDPRWWLPIGGVIGLGMMTKYTILFLVAGIVAGTLLTPLRRHVRSRWLWFGVALSLLIYLPNLLWQIQHDFISLEFLQSIHDRDVSMGRTGGFFTGQFTTAANLLTVPLWLAGAWFLLGSREGKPYRILGLMWLVPLTLFALAGGRAYYMAGATPVLLSAGAVVWDRLMETRVRWRRNAIALATSLLLIVGAVGIGAVMLPIGKVNSALWRAALEAHDNFAEQIGWDDLVIEVERVYTSMPPEERSRAGILTGNYGEAGAVSLLGRERGLPEPISGVNSWWQRGFRNAPEVVIVLGIDYEDATRIFESCAVEGTMKNRYGVENEESRDHAEILVCRQPVAPWPVIWPHLRGFG